VDTPRDVANRAGTIENVAPCDPRAQDAQRSVPAATEQQQQQQQQHHQHTHKQRAGNWTQLEKFQFMGYNFEHLCCAADPDASAAGQDDTGRGSAPMAARVVDANASFCTVFRSSLGGVELVAAGEVDALTADGRGYVEIKTCTDPALLPERPARAHHAVKVPKWWLQSHLAGVGTAVIGARARDGRVTDVRVVGNDILRPTDGDALLAAGARIARWLCESCEQDAGGSAGSGDARYTVVWDAPWDAVRLCRARDAAFVEPGFAAWRRADTVPTSGSKRKREQD
jgi:hypothetical protein